MDATISAIATALGVGAVGIIRISGPESLAMANRIFSARNPLSRDRARYMQYGFIHDAEGNYVDEVLAVYMPGPHSYTGEDVVEIQCHGGREALQEILRLTFEAGARPAEPGEFTKRAFLNGRLDLTEAEAVMDVITAKSKRALIAANRGHKGALSSKVKAIRKALKDLDMGSAVDKVITVEAIQELVASRYKIRVEDLKAKKRTRSIAYPRQIAMYLTRELTDLSLPRIGECFGGRDHTTVLHACDKISEDKKNDANLERQLAKLVEDLKK